MSEELIWGSESPQEGVEVPTNKLRYLKKGIAIVLQQLWIINLKDIMGETLESREEWREVPTIEEDKPEFISYDSPGFLDGKPVYVED